MFTVSVEVPCHLKLFMRANTGADLVLNVCFLHKLIRTWGRPALTSAMIRIWSLTGFPPGITVNYVRKLNMALRSGEQVFYFLVCANRALYSMMAKMKSTGGLPFKSFTTMCDHFVLFLLTGAYVDAVHGYSCLHAVFNWAHRCCSIFEKYIHSIIPQYNKYFLALNVSFNSVWIGL